MKALPIDFYNMTLNRDGAAKTLNTAASDSDHVPCVLRFVCSINMGGGKSSCGTNKVIAPTLDCAHQGEPVICQVRS